MTTSIATGIGDNSNINETRRWQNHHMTHHATDQLQYFQPNYLIFVRSENENSANENGFMSPPPSYEYVLAEDQMLQEGYLRENGLRNDTIFTISNNTDSRRDRLNNVFGSARSAVSRTISRDSNAQEKKTTLLKHAKLVADVFVQALFYGFSILMFILGIVNSIKCSTFGFECIPLFLTAIFQIVFLLDVFNEKWEKLNKMAPVIRFCLIFTLFLAIIWIISFDVVCDSCSYFFSKTNYTAKHQASNSKNTNHKNYRIPGTPEEWFCYHLHNVNQGVIITDTLLMVLLTSFLCLVNAFNLK